MQRHFACLLLLKAYSPLPPKKKKQKWPDHEASRPPASISSQIDTRVAQSYRESRRESTPSKLDDATSTNNHLSLSLVIYIRD
jgi:hypothetical protein